MHKGLMRTHQILLDLLDRDTYISNQALSKKYNCSQRTIRSEIEVIKQILSTYGLEISTKKNMGYLIISNDKIDREVIKNDYLEEKCVVPETPDERTYYILKRLLMNEQYITISELADELYISKPSITHCLKRVKEILDQYQLFVENKPHYGLKVQGQEENLRRCIIEHGIQYNNLNEVADYEDVQNTSFFSDIDFNIIHRIIQEEIKKENISFYEMYYNNLIIHIAVAIKRIRGESFIEECIIPDKDNFTLDVQVAHSIAESLGKEFDIVFPESEIKYIAIHLIGNKIASLSKKSLYLDETYILVNKFLLIASQEFDIDFMNDDVLKNDLYLHLKSALARMQLGISMKNPMIQQIKDNYPFPFEIVVSVCNNQELNLGELSEEEIGYVVIHFAAALERLKEKNKNSQKKKVLIFCASGIGTVRLLEAKLKSEFKDMIEITSLCQMSNLKEVENDYSLILSTIPIEIECENLLVVNAIPTKVDLMNISRVLYKKNKGVKYQVQDVFHEDLFLIQNKKTNKKEILKLISEKLFEHGYVDENFYQSLLERENIVDTGIGELFAIPHAMKNVALKNGIFVCILKDPIDWSENKKVQILFVLVIKRSEAKNFEKIYDLIVQIASDIEIVNQFIDCCDYNETLNLLKKLENI